MNQNGNNYRGPRPAGGSASSGGRQGGIRPAGGQGAPGGNRPRPSNPLSAPRRRKQRSPLPLLVLGGIFLICFALYLGAFLLPSSTKEPAGGTTTPPKTDPPQTQGTEPPATQGTDPAATQTAPQTQTKPPLIDPAALYTVVLDPGHGFRDGGCHTDYLGDWNERELTLDMCRRIEPILRAKGVNVLYTHDGETFPSVTELNTLAASLSYSMETVTRSLIRTYGFDKNGAAVNENSVWNAFSGNLSDSGTGSQIFNVYERAYYINLLDAQQKIDAMVSVHVNSVDTTDPGVNLDNFHGYTVSYCAANAFGDTSARLQSGVVNALTAAFPGKRVVRYADPWYDSLVILKYSSAPAILIETGYAVKEDEARDLLSESWRQTMSEAIAQGVLSYLGIS